MTQPSFGSLLTFGFVCQFRAGARVYDGGYELEDINIQRAGLKAMKAVVKELDLLGGAKGRNALIPLLDDPDEGVRVHAAAFLLKRLPERAVAVLTEIDERSLTRTQMTASKMLDSHKRGDLDL
jgi:hypothetical protein